MRVGYVRISKAGPTKAEQEAAIFAAGAPRRRDIPIYVDHPPKPSAKREARHPVRREAIAALRKGDVLVVASPSRLGSTMEDVLQAIREIGERGAKLLVASTGQSYAWLPDAVAIAEFAAQAEREGSAERARKMRQRKAEIGGALGGPPPRLHKGSKEWLEAETLWKDASKSGAEVAAKTGVSVRTLYRLFGERGTPRFGEKTRVNRR